MFTKCLLPRQNQTMFKIKMAAVNFSKFVFSKVIFADSILRLPSAAVRFNSTRSQILDKKFRQGNAGLIALGIGAGAAVGAGLSWRRFNEVKPPVLNDAVGKETIILTEVPNVKIARKIISPTDSTNLHLVLFQYPTCPFCCKVRAFLDYYGFSYDVVEVDPVLRREMSWSEYKKVPILLAKTDDGYLQLNDSSMIVSALKSFIHDRETKLKDVVTCYPTMQYRDDEGALKSEVMNRYYLMFHSDVPKTHDSDKKIVEERKWRKWADDSLVHTLSPNVYRTREESLQAFNWFSEVGEWDVLFPSWERNLIVYAGAFAMWMIGKRLKKRHQLKDDVRQSLYDECNRWMWALRDKGTPFMGGTTPNLSDLAVYGVLSSIEGCIAFADLKKNTNIAKWYEPMKAAVKSHQGSQDILR